MVESTLSGAYTELRNAVVVDPLEAKGWTPKEVPPMFVQSWEYLRYGLEPITSPDEIDFIQDYGRAQYLENRHTYVREVQLNKAKIPDFLTRFFSGLKINGQWISPNIHGIRGKPNGDMIFEGRSSKTAENGTSEIFKSITINFSPDEQPFILIAELNRASNGDVAVRRLEINSQDAYTYIADLLDLCEIYHQTDEKLYVLEHENGGRVISGDISFFKQKEKAQLSTIPLWQVYGRLAVQSSWSGARMTYSAIDDQKWWDNHKTSPAGPLDVFNGMLDNRAYYYLGNPERREYDEKGNRLKIHIDGREWVPEKTYPLNYVLSFLPIDEELFKENSSIKIPSQEIT